MSNRPARAPWRDALDNDLQRASTPRHEFTLATVEKAEQGRSLPRLRVCGFRGFFPEIELHPNGEKDMQEQVVNGGNPSLFESDMLTFTTDKRMEKLRQLESSDGEIEALFWFAEVPSQWRIRGRAFAIGDPRGDVEDGEIRARDVIEKSIRLTPDGTMESWNWEHAVTGYFASHSPLARGKQSDILSTYLGHRLMDLGTFKAPPPGRPMQDSLAESPLHQGQAVTGLYDSVARENFRVVVIIAWEVEQLDLSDRDCLRRRKWTREGSSRWIHTELYP